MSRAGTSGPGRPSSCDITRNGAPSVFGRRVRTRPPPEPEPRSAASACEDPGLAAEVVDGPGRNRGRQANDEAPLGPPRDRATSPSGFRWSSRCSAGSTLAISYPAAGQRFAHHAVSPRASSASSRRARVVILGRDATNSRPRSTMTTDDGTLVATDETFSHQIVETHARVAQADRSWTEKVCAMAAARDGSLQVAFGVGKYTNRNVFDGYAGVSRGKEQWTVRASRRLERRTRSHRRGTDRLRDRRAVPSACASRARRTTRCPIAFEWIFDVRRSPAARAPRPRTSPRRGTRLDVDVLRYHQIGLASGWVEVDGARTEITPDTWFTTRDHSWGVRQDVGLPPTDVEGVGRSGESAARPVVPVLVEPDAARTARRHALRHPSPTPIDPRVRLRGDDGRRRGRARRRAGRARSPRCGPSCASTR